MNLFTSSDAHESMAIDSNFVDTMGQPSGLQEIEDEMAISTEPYLMESEIVDDFLNSPSGCLSTGRSPSVPSGVDRNQMIVSNINSLFQVAINDNFHAPRPEAPRTTPAKNFFGDFSGMDLQRLAWVTRSITAQVDEQIYDMIGTSTLTVVTTCGAAEYPQELHPGYRPTSDQGLVGFRASASTSPPSQGWFWPTYFELGFKDCQDRFTSDLSCDSCRQEQLDLGYYTRREFHFYNPQDRLKMTFLSVFYRDERKNGKFKLEEAKITVARVREWLSLGHREVEQ